MRDLARLYIIIDEQQEEDEAEGKNPSPARPVKNFTDCIDSKKFNLVIKGVQSLADVSVLFIRSKGSLISMQNLNNIVSNTAIFFSCG